MKWKRFWFAAALTVCMSYQVRAQAFGKIVGTVTDASGAVIVGAKITASEKGTGFTRSTVTSTGGTYTLPVLPVGVYLISGESAGFKNGRAEVSLDVNQAREVNFKLAPAQTEINVEVNADPPLLDTTDSTLGGLISGQQVVTLPLNGRDITGLMLLQPGVEFEQNLMFPVTSNPSGSQLVAANGNRGPTGSSYLDGLDTSDAELGGAQFTNFNLDAIAEFRILQNNYSAEYGRGSGSIVQQVSKAGTDEFHGSAFEFLRNGALDARNWFAQTRAPFKRNEFGATFGGPVLRNRTFFFIQYAGFRQRLGELQTLSVPTLNERMGIVDFNCQAANGCNGRQGPDQYLVPLNSIAAQVLGSYPKPDNPTGSFGPNTYLVNYSVPLNSDQGSARIDQRFSERDQLFVRYTEAHNVEPVGNPSYAAIRPDFSSTLSNIERNAGGAETHTFSPTLLNTFKFAYTVTDDPWIPGNQTFSQMQFLDGSLSPWGTYPFGVHLHHDTYLFNDTVSWVKGRNTISTGAEFRFGAAPESGSSVGGPNGSYNFANGQRLPQAVPSASGTNNLPAGSPSPSSLISFMEGAPSFFQRTISFPGFGPVGGGVAKWDLHRYSVNGWFQDDLRTTERLTLNLGFRYEFNAVPWEVDGRTTGIVDDPKFKGGSLYRHLVLNPHPLWYPDYRGFGPRFGLAYKVKEKTVVRGGFGIFTNLPLTETADQQTASFPYAGTNNTANPPMGTGPIPVPNLPALKDLNGNTIPPAGKVPANTPVDLSFYPSLFGSPLLINLTDQHLRNGYTMAGNFTLEQQLPGDVALQAAYVMNNAVKLYASEWPNAYGCAGTPGNGCPLPQYTPYSAASPGLGEFQLTDNHAHSTYNSLQMMARKNSPRRGLEFQASYTFSKAIDNATTVFNGPVTNSAILQSNPTCFSCERGPSSNDIRHRFVANFTYAIPLDKWQTFLPPKLAGGWQITSIVQVQSGAPFTVNTPYGTQQFGIDQYLGVQPTRPDLVQQPTLNPQHDSPQYFSDVVTQDGQNLTQQFFATPGCGPLPNPGCIVQSRPGDLGRNTFYIRHYANTDFSLLKDTGLTERIRLQFRAEFFNVFNEHQFSFPGTLLGSPGFGVATGTQGPERQIQFGLRTTF